MTEQTGQAQLNESLSALMDGRASDMELHRILKASESDASVRATWSRYQLVSQVMQGQAPAAPAWDLSSAVRDAIAAEEAPRKNWFGQLARMAVAASVAGVVVMTAQLVGQDAGRSGDQVPALTAEAPAVNAVSPATLSLPAGFQAPAVTARTVSSESRGSFRPVERAASMPGNAQLILKAPVSAPSEAVQRHIQDVLSLHATQAAMNSNRGMLPYARVPAPAQAVE